MEATNKGFFRFEQLSTHLASVGWTAVRYPWLTKKRLPEECSTPINIPRSQEAIDFMDLMWDLKIWQHLLQKTNAKLLGKHAQIVTIPELRRYFGQVCIFGILKLSEISDLWSENDIVITYPGKDRGLSRDRWQYLNTHMGFDITTLHSFPHQFLQITPHSWDLHYDR